MICYLATFPRSGFAILKFALIRNWGYVAANAYSETPLGPKVDVREIGDPDILSYQARGTTNRHRLLRSPALSRLTPSLRERLAAEDELYLIKTHERPPETAFAGECAIQIVRHPAGAILSQWKLHRATHGESPPLAHFIEGGELGGRWGDWHEAWLDAPMPVWRMRREDALAAPLSLVHGVADFLGLPPPAKLYRVTAEEMGRQKNRNLAQEWQAEITVAQLQHIELRHKQTARKFGYYAFGVFEPYVCDTPPARMCTQPVVAAE